MEKKNYHEEQSKIKNYIKGLQYLQNISNKFTGTGGSK